MPATKSALRGSQSAAPATKSPLQGPQSTAPAMKCAFQGPQSTAPATIPENEPHVQKSRCTALVKKSERLEDYHHAQSAAPGTQSTHRSKTAPIPCTCHERPTLDLQSTRIPLRLPRQVATMSESRHKHPPWTTRFCEPAQSKCTSRISRGMNAR